MKWKKLRINQVTQDDLENGFKTALAQLITHSLQTFSCSGISLIFKMTWTVGLTTNLNVFSALHNCKQRYYLPTSANIVTSNLLPDWFDRVYPSLQHSHTDTHTHTQTCSPIWSTAISNNLLLTVRVEYVFRNQLLELSVYTVLYSYNS